MVNKWQLFESLSLTNTHTEYHVLTLLSVCVCVSLLHPSAVPVLSQDKRSVCVCVFMVNNSSL